MFSLMFYFLAFLSEDRENELLNMEMQDDFFQKQNDRQYKEMIAFRRKLPAFEKKMVIMIFYPVDDDQ